VADGEVELTERATGDTQRIGIGDAASGVAERLAGA
jgi:hypothetical protein